MDEIRTAAGYKDMALCPRKRTLSTAGRNRAAAVRDQEDDLDSADFDALEEKARARLSPAAYAFAAGGADDEITVAANIAAWRLLRLRAPERERPKPRARHRQPHYRDDDGRS